MKADLDAIMTRRNIDALLVRGGVHGNPAMMYLANGAKVGEHTVLVKKRGEAPVLVVSAMERDSAAQSGLAVRTMGEFGYTNIHKSTGGDRLQTTILFMARLLEALDVHGRVAVFGRMEAGEALNIYPRLADRLAPDIEIVGEFEETVFSEAMLTKDADEIARIAAVGRKTLTIVDNVKDRLAGSAHNGSHLLRPDGEPLTVGDIRRDIFRTYHEHGLEDPSGPIFAIGYDSTVPHSAGTDSDVVALGQTIVFDIYPREMGGGYFYDFTRTWCVGHAPDETMAIWETVRAAFDVAMAALTPGSDCRAPQQAVVDFFGKHGHQVTDREGYVHGLGHSVGLEVHEPPYLSLYANGKWTIQPGQVFTVEPGLYYPSKKVGVRIEDFVWLNPDSLQWDTIPHAYPKDLVVPLG